MTQMTEDRDHLYCVEVMNWDETDCKPILSPIPDEHQLSCISCSDYMEDKITETDVIKPIPSECTFPYATDVLEQEWKICEIGNDEDEPKAKRWNSIQNEIKNFNIELADAIHYDSQINYFSERNQSLNSSKESASKASSVDVRKKSGKKLIRSYESPCAACKFLRRKCVPDCFFAPYFPAHEPQKFASIHKIFGASNVCKLLTDLPTHQREDAVDSLAYEAETRLRDPVHGCVGVISLLQKRVLELQKKLKAANADSCNEIPTAFPACPGASSVEGMKDGFIGGTYDKKPIQVQNDPHPSSYNPPCAACKLLKIMCKPGCIFAPYFSADKPQEFENIHRIYGASNVSKILHEILPHQRADAMTSLVYEADARVRDPVYGCYGAISSLRKQEEELKRKLDTDPSIPCRNKMKSSSKLSKGWIMFMETRRRELLQRRAVIEAQLKGQGKSLDSSTP